MVAQAGASPVVRVGAGDGTQSVDQHVIESPAAPVLSEGPARLPLGIAVQRPKRVDPPAPRQALHERQLRAVPAVPAVRPQTTGAVTGERDDLPVRELTAWRIEIAAQDSPPAI